MSRRKLELAALVSFLAALVSFPAQAQVATVTLNWTAPGDDGLAGTATLYEIRYSQTKPDTTSQTTIATWWAAAKIETGIPLPHAAGTLESDTVGQTGGFPAGTTWYFVLRTADEVGNWSPFSNVAVKVVGSPDVTPPGRTFDFRTL